MRGRDCRGILFMGMRLPAETALYRAATWLPLAVWAQSPFSRGQFADRVRFGLISSNKSALSLFNIRLDEQADCSTSSALDDEIILSPQGK